MNSTWIIAALASGVVLGAIYFGGLWLTVRRVPLVRQPALLLLGSFLLRSAVVLLGFYVVMDGRWERLVACMIGFLLARTLFLHCLRNVGQVSQPPTLSVEPKSTTE